MINRKFITFNSRTNHSRDVGKHFQSYSKKLIKYEIYRYINIESGPHKETKFISKSELDKYLKEDWGFVRKKYFIITPFLDWWKPISFTNKVAIFGIILSAILTLLLWSLSEYFEYKESNLKTENALLIKRCDSLKKLNDSLNLNFDSLKERFLSLNDTLNEKNKLIEKLRE